MKGPGATGYRNTNAGSTGASESAPGKRTLTEQLQMKADPAALVVGKQTLAEALPAVQRQQDAASGLEDGEVRQQAARGVKGAGGELPHRERIEASFGRDLSHMRAHVGGSAAEASQAIGAEAYAVGNDVAFRGAPSLHTAAHEAAHVEQQAAGVSLLGGVGRAGDEYERNADEVADRVVAGKSAADLLPGTASGFGKAGGATQRQAHAPWGAVQRKVHPDVASFTAAGPYKIKDHVPSTGRGAFDVEYKPDTSELGITVRMNTVFVDNGTQKWTDQKEKDKWFADYQSAVATRWGGQYTMKATKAGFDTLKAKTAVEIKKDDKDPHDKLTVKKMAPGVYDDDTAVDRPKNFKEQAPGNHLPFDGTRNAQFGSTDTTVQPNWQSAEVRGTEVARMQSSNPKKVVFTKDSDAIAGGDQAKLAMFGTILSMTKKPKLTVRVIGRASTGEVNAQDLAQRRADNAVAQMRAGGTISHDVIVKVEGSAGAGATADWQRVELTIDTLPTTQKNDYDIAGHETGHMFGFGEEYKGTEKSPHYQLVEESLGKKVADTFVSREARSASIMSSGLDVRPYHYVTFWEALGRATEPTLTRKDWKIEH